MIRETEVTSGQYRLITGQNIEEKMTIEWAALNETSVSNPGLRELSRRGGRKDVRAKVWGGVF